jgi:pimeloyl-ACP methyl ester carboxylesterase
MEGWEIYAVDLPGHGDSGGNPETTISGYASRLVAWMDALELRKVVLVGHSMGGAISQSIALDYPNRVAGLVLVGSGAKLRVHPQILSLTEDEASYQQAAELVTTWAFSSETPDRLKELALSRMSAVPAHVVHADFMACDNFNIMERLSEIETPCLILCGEKDLLTPVKYSRYLEDRLPDAKLVVVPGAGHMAMLEKPEAVVAPIRAFLNRL